MSFLRALVLLVVATCALAQITCGTGGQADTFQTGMCNCYSGYAPTTPEGVDCKQHPKCAPNVAEDVSTMNSYAPIRPITYFAYDSLEIVQQVPLVANRKSAYIQFVIPTGFPNAGNAGLKTCQYPGPLWNKTVNGFNCIDEYRASVPWSQNGACGFVHDVARSVNNTNVITSTLVTTVVDTFTSGGTTYQRLSTTSYLISVSFATRVTIPSQTFNVNIPDPTSANVLSKYIVSDSVYDPATGITSVSLVTSVVWPYKIGTSATALATAFQSVVPAIAGVLVTIANADDSTVSCPAESRSICSQKWKASFASSGACIDNLKGLYSFVVPLFCRDNMVGGVAGSCPTGMPTISFSINVRDTSLCGTTPVDTAPANAYHLTSYSDSAFSVTSAQFQTGDTVYWTFDIENPVVSIKTVTFNTIQMVLVSNTGGAIAGAIPDVLITSGAVTAVGSAVNLQTKGLSGMIAPGTTGTLSFSYVLNRGQLVHTVSALTSTNLQATIALSVVVDIQYYGNSRRSVAMDFGAMEALSAGHDTRQFRVVAAVDMTTPENPEVAGNTAELSETSSASKLTLMTLLSVVVFFFLF